MVLNFKYMSMKHNMAVHVFKCFSKLFSDVCKSMLLQSQKLLAVKFTRAVVI